MVYNTNTTMNTKITIQGARLHNLKNISLSIPKEQLVALTGVSGSGKSTLALDILNREAMRQYMQALGLVTFGMEKPPVDAIIGLTPAISIDQYSGSNNPRSTVGTLTEIFTYLRVLYARLGRRPCPDCKKEIPPLFDPSSEGTLEGDAEIADQAETSACPHCGTPVPTLTMAHFSFNKPAGACPFCTGLGSIHTANLAMLVDENKSISGGAVYGWNETLIQYHRGPLLAAAAHYGLGLDMAQPVCQFSPQAKDLLYYGAESALFQRHFPDIPVPQTVRAGRFEGVATNLLRRHALHLQEHESETGYRDKLEDFLITQVCPQCQGARLRTESLAVQVAGKSIIEALHLPLDMLAGWLDGLTPFLSADETRVARPVLTDLHERTARLLDVGVGYLTLERAANTLSAGEYQRLRLAALLGSSLTGMLYILDEPTIGLHPRDTERLMNLLRRLRGPGNTVLVIEHDLDVIASADYILDFGPGAGRHGGEIIAHGTPAELAQAQGSLTGAYLAKRAPSATPTASPVRRPPTEKAIHIIGAREHNLQNVDVRLPLGLLLAVTGVSGSGKSTLVFDILARALLGGEEPAGAHDALTGREHIRRVINIGQEPVGRIPRSNVATYADIFTPIREVFAAQEQARMQGFTPAHFSFNLPGGRCERCLGSGTLAINMHFLPDVEVRCPACHGRRFGRDVLSITWRGTDIATVLEQTVEEARALFTGLPVLEAKLQVLVDIGLGYLQLGQPVNTLSGGETQRLRLAKELGRRAGKNTLYLLDEPTTGLHPHDVSRLLGVLQRLVDSGGSVIVVEHNLQVISAADWVVDLGPEGGMAGGRVLAEGTPEAVAQHPASYTGQHLQRHLIKG